MYKFKLLLYVKLKYNAPELILHNLLTNQVWKTLCIFSRFYTKYISDNFVMLMKVK